MKDVAMLAHSSLDKLLMFSLALFSPNQTDVGRFQTLVGRGAHFATALRPNSSSFPPFLSFSIGSFQKKKCFFSQPPPPPPRRRPYFFLFLNFEVEKKTDTDQLGKSKATDQSRSTSETDNKRSANGAPPPPPCHAPPPGRTGCGQLTQCLPRFVC